MHMYTNTNTSSCYACVPTSVCGRYYNCQGLCRRRDQVLYILERSLYGSALINREITRTASRV